MRVVVAASTGSGSVEVNTASKTSSFGNVVVPPSSGRPLKKIAIIGCGPSGLLVAHRLLKLIIQQQQDDRITTPSKPTSTSTTIDMFERRSRPMSYATVQQQAEEQEDEVSYTSSSGGRAYALGIGIRGRTAIQSVDNDLWFNSVQSVGYPCSKFDFHVGGGTGFRIRLRDDDKNRSSSSSQQQQQQQPSILLYQNDLCSSLIDELERRDQRHIQIHFNTAINDININNRCIMATTTASTPTEKEQQQQQQQQFQQPSQPQPEKTYGPYDLIIGCDGVNSIVRDVLYNTCNPTFETKRTTLPGEFKTIRLKLLSKKKNFELSSRTTTTTSTFQGTKIQPDAVSLVLPKTSNGGITAFVEPTANDTCCVLFASSSSSSSKAKEEEEEITETILNSNNITYVAIELQKQFPFLDSNNDDDDDDEGSKSDRSSSLYWQAAKQLINIQQPSRASSIQCNIYHHYYYSQDNNNNNDGLGLVLVGDSAHATGGVSGQGVNSALMDAKILIDCLITNAPQASAGASASSSNILWLRDALLSYSQKQVPEGKALYDLSFGISSSTSTKPSSLFKRFKNALQTALDAIFQGRYGIGRIPIQTLLTTSLQSFANIRRERYNNNNNNENNNNNDNSELFFPDESIWNNTIQQLSQNMYRQQQQQQRQQQ